MSFEILCHFRFHLVWSASVNLNLFQISIEWFRTLKPISGWMGWVGWVGWLSLYDGLLRAPTVLKMTKCEIDWWLRFRSKVEEGGWSKFH